MQKSSSKSSLSYKRKNLTNLSFLTKLETSCIEHLDFSENFLQNFQEFKGLHFPSLRTLSLSSNMISDIGGLQGSDFPALEKLYLYGNEIENLSPLSSISAPNLLELKLGFKHNGNEITSQAMEDMLLRLDLPQLCELTLDYNKIISVNFLHSKQLRPLTLLYLSGNQILSIDKTALQGMENLKTLSLKNNYLTNCQFLKGLVLLQLEYLNFSHNFITGLDGIYQADLKNLTRIAIYGNPLQDISILFKCQWEEASDILTYGETSCVPFLLQDKIMKQIKKKFLYID